MTPLAVWATVAVAVLGLAGTTLNAVIGYRATRTATAITTQATAQTSTMESVDRRISEVLDARDADVSRLQQEVGRRQEREDRLLDRLGRLEAAFDSYRSATDAKIRDQDAKIRDQDAAIRTLTAEVHALRSTDREWRRWAGQVVLWSEEATERLHKHGEPIPPLPPSPPLT